MENIRPTLKQFGQLQTSDFEKYPVWIAVHGSDEEEPWYEDCDEETFRPWEGPLPAGPEEGMLLAAADFVFADGTAVPGFLTPQHAGEPLDLGNIQPQVFSPGRQHSFWDGMRQRSEEEKREFYGDFNKSKDEIFPIRFSAKPGLASGESAGTIEGFYYLDKGGVVVHQ